MKSLLIALLIVALIVGVPMSHTSAAPGAGGEGQVDVRIVDDEAGDVLSILEIKSANRPITDADWKRLLATEGYLRLKKRELSMSRSFDDAEFKAFVLSDELAKGAALLRKTVDAWKQADMTAAAARALAYLPAGASIRAKIYPVIKPGKNSFVFEVKADPAIFLYVDPDETKDQFENTVAHELHHIGYGGSCPPAAAADEISKLPAKTGKMLDWVGAFGEGMAMLAAAGGPDVHPHQVSKPEDRQRWDRDMANFNADLLKVDKFFRDVLEGRLEGDEISKVAYSFFGIQGPWYTVGWKMAVTIEKTYGRARLIECFCDPRGLLPAYNQAAREHNRASGDSLALWSDAVIGASARPK
jgi:hypothetical protein